MATSSSSPKSHFHARSNSLPSRPRPLASQIDECLSRLRATETTSSSICNNIIGLSDLYDLLNNLLLLPHTQQALAQECNKKQVDDLLDRSLRLMDVCGTAKDALTQMKEDTQVLESTLRRRRGDESRVSNEVGAYLRSRKKANKAIHKSLRVLKTSPCSSSESETIAMIIILRELEGVTYTVFESLLSYLSGTKGQSYQSRWSLVSKLIHTKRVTCEAEAIEINEFEKVDAALCSLIGNKSRKSTFLNPEDVHNMLGELESCTQDLEGGLESLQRRLIKTRVSLLNFLSH
ncbi:hypothetical protein AB3S75_043808 [Citrus x aurantiifolia]